MSKIIAVTGATGLQVGSLVKTLLEAGNYHIRAITRNANSEKAKELASLKNVTVHEENLDDPASLDPVLNEAYGAFLVTDWPAQVEGKAD